MKDNINGLLVVNKPYGITSRDVVNKLTKKFNTKKIGHTGTLDPLATGVLVCTIGKCTKLNEYLVSTTKEYEVTLSLGYETDTLDSEGKVLYTNKKILTREEIENTIESFIGSYDQEVPAYSSVKVNGKKLYEYARSGIEVKLPSRIVNIYNIDNITIGENEVSFKVKVSKGTYIRSLVRDIGRKLGSYATMTKLTRISQGIYDINDSYTLEDIDSDNYKIITLEEIFSDIPKIDLDEELYFKINNGVPYDSELDSTYLVFKYNNEIICLYKKIDDSYKMYIKFK